MFIGELVRSLPIFQTWQKRLGNGTIASLIAPVLRKQGTVRVILSQMEQNLPSKVQPEAEKRVAIDHAKLLLNAPRPLPILRLYVNNRYPYFR